MALPLASGYGVLFDVPAYVSLAAALGLVLLLPLYFSQRRDLARLREWMEREPEHPAADLTGSEALLDRSEAELEALLGPDEAPAAPAPEGAPAVQEPTAAGPPTPAPVTPVPPARRVTTERPALDRITIERAALLPHSRWHRFTARVGQPRVLAIAAAAAVVLGLAAIFGSEQLLSGNEGSSGSPRPGAIVPADVNVAVLNATSAPGLAAKVGDDVRVNGFSLGTVSNSRRQFGQTVVMYEPHQLRAAKRVAHALGVKPVQPIDQATQHAAGSDADVVVIAGADRAKL